MSFIVPYIVDVINLLWVRLCVCLGWCFVVLVLLCILCLNVITFGLVWV